MKTNAVIIAVLMLALGGCGRALSPSDPAGVLPQARPAPQPHAGSGNVIQDPGFESGGFTYWKQCGTISAKIQKSIVHSGTYAEFGGTLGDPELKGDAAVCQDVTVPPFGRLSFWLNATTTDTLEYAWETASLIGPKGQTLITFYQLAANTNGWVKKSFDASAFSGQRVRLQFDVHGNGYSNAYINAAIDDVSLVSGTPTPSPSPSATPVAGSPIQHVVIVLQENRTFDNLFHGYRGADYANSGKTSDGKTVPMREVRLMTPWDPSHEYEDWLTEYNNGAMNGFNLNTIDYGSGAPPNFAYSYARQSDVQPYWDLAKEGVLADHMFADHRSQSFAGHLFPIAGASGPIAANLPDWYAANNPSGGESCADPGTAKPSTSKPATRTRSTAPVSTSKPSRTCSIKRAFRGISTSIRIPATITSRVSR